MKDNSDNSFVTVLAGNYQLPLRHKPGQIVRISFTVRRRELERLATCVVPGLFELRSRNQYVVGPGSFHPSGAVYQITADYEVLPMPGWLVDCLLYLKGAASTVPAGQKWKSRSPAKSGKGRAATIS
jgi:hypothetical protein